MQNQKTNQLYEAVECSRELPSEEDWRPVPAMEEYYHVSNLGRIKALKTNKKPERIVKPCITGGGYLQIQLGRLPIKKSIQAHRLVAMAFIANPENKPFINHINGIKEDNRVANLEWCTRSENTIHALEHGLMQSGPTRSNAKLTYEDVEAIKAKRAEGMTFASLASMYGVSPSAVSYAANNKSYRYKDSPQYTPRTK